MAIKKPTYTGPDKLLHRIIEAIRDIIDGIPTKTSDLTNDSGFITNAVNNLANYYLKSETYTQAQVDALISAIATMHFEVVASLPVSDIQTNVIYLVPSSDPGAQNIYDEYINTTGTSAGWELIGSTQVDLSDYVTTSDLATALSDYVTNTDLTTILADYVESADLATVATTGDYDDLTNKPTIPAAQVQSDWNQADSTAVDYIKNKPTIPPGGDTVSWTQVQQSGTKIAEIDINGTSQDVYAPSGGGSTYTEGDGIDISAQNEISVDTTFTEASTRANIASGDTFATILGKIKKWFTDIPNMFVSKTGDTMTGDLTVDEGNASSYVKVGGATSKGNVRVYNSGGRYIDFRYDDSATHNRSVSFPDVNGGIAALRNVNNNFSADQTIDGAAGTAGGSESWSSLALGNATGRASAKHSNGRIRLYRSANASASTAYYTEIRPGANTANRTATFPDASGTLALDYEDVFDIALKNGWTGNIRVTHNKNTRITSLSGVLIGTNATSNVFADATTDANNTTKIPVSVQSVRIVPNLMVTNYPITFAQVSGNDWQASIDKSVGSVAICMVYTSAT